MSDSDEESKIEINAPPKAIEIEISPAAAESTQQPVNQGAMLTGGIGQMSQENFLSIQPQNVKFVMGPNGQMIAIEKPPFVWKHFWIGGGIPFAIFFVPMLILMIGAGLDYDDDDDDSREVTLYQDENSTAYRGEFTLEEDNYLSWCGIRYSENADYWRDMDIHCDRYDDYKANILYPGYEGEVVGNWDNENGTVYFDTGTDHGEELILQMEYYSESESYELFSIVSDLAGAACCLGLLLSIVFLIVGFSQGKPGMGWGGVTALLSFPVVGAIWLLVI
tara:strand:- start:595 stop:1428 length:834 start_codon:yes stop_codon:yes gene_type:complete